MRGRPRSAAQRPLPSMMRAIWRGGPKPEPDLAAAGIVDDVETSGIDYRLFQSARGPVTSNRSGAPPRIGCCRCAHLEVPISNEPEIGELANRNPQPLTGSHRFR